MANPCLVGAWSSTEHELRGYLLHRLGHPEDVEDLLQEIFIKALRQGTNFCQVKNPRAWLFQVARNALADRLRLAHEVVPLPEGLEAPESEMQPVVDDLTQCLPRVLSELSEEDRLAIVMCDIQGKSQQELAEHFAVSLSGAKSRIQRARKRLRAQMEKGCQVRYDEHGNVVSFVPRPPIGR